MTREEAIQVLQEKIDNRPLFKDEREAFMVAIEALSADTVQGCDGCKYNTRIPQEECLMCKRYWRDGYERKGGEDE